MSLILTGTRFGIVGVATAVIHYGLLYAGVEWLGLGATVASSLGFVVAVLFNYRMHHGWTFGGAAPHGRAVPRYLVMVGSGFVINAAVMYAGVQWQGWHYLAVQLLALVLVVLWNFTLANAWVFRGTRGIDA